MKRTCLLIIGMHRSGTSALAGALSAVGIQFGRSVVPPSYDNPKGFYENEKIQILNDTILEKLGSAWDYPEFLPDHWWEYKEILEFEKKAIKLVKKEFQNEALFCIKDPRISILFPLWANVMKQLKIQVKVIFALRDPDELAQSLEKRNYFSRQKTYALTAYHLLEAELHSRKTERIIVGYDQLLQNPTKTVLDIVQRLELQILKPPNPEDINGSIYKNLRNFVARKSASAGKNTHSNTTKRDKLESLAKEIYASLEIGLKKRHFDIAKMDQKRVELYVLLKELGSSQKENPKHFIKLLIDDGTGYSEKKSLIRPINDHNCTWVFPIKEEYKAIKEIRILVANKACKVKIQGLKFDFVEEAVEYEWSDNSEYNKEGHIFFDKEFPEIILTFDSLTQVNQFSLEIEYLAIFNVSQEGTKILNSSSLGRRILDSFLAVFQHPIELLKNINLKNIRTLRAALKRENPRLILRNFKKLLEKKKIQKQIDLHTSIEKHAMLGTSKQSIHDSENISVKENLKSKSYLSKILYITPQLPDYDSSSGGRRAFELLKLLAEDCEIFVYPISTEKRKYREKLESIGVKIISKKEYRNIKENIPSLDAIIFAWYFSFYECLELSALYSDAIKIIDSVDIHWVREERSIGFWEGITKEQAEKNKTQEINAYRSVDSIWAVSKADKAALLKEVPNAKVQIVSNVHGINKTKYVEKPNTILFFGGFSHYPNLSAIEILANKIFPKVLSKISDARLFIAGSNAPIEVAELGKKKNIEFLGFIENEEIEELYERSLLSVSPLIIGSGIKGKITEAISYMTPVVTTSIGNEGINLENEKSALITDDFDVMAELIINAMNGEYDLAQMAKKAQQKLVKVVSPSLAKEQMFSSFLKEINICIVTWNRLELLKKCINSILENTTYPLFRISIHSNGCTDGTQDYLRSIAKVDKRIFPIYSDKNEVFVLPNNRMMNSVPEADVALLNNDTEVTKAWLLAMYKAAYSTKNVGIVGAKLLFPDGRLQEYGSELYDDGMGRNIGKWEENPFAKEYSQDKAVGYVSGCAMYIKRETIDKIGVFNENFHPCYYEDSDYCYSAWKNDIQTIVCSESIIYHSEGATAGKDEGKGYKKFQEINRQKFIDKHGKYMHDYRNKIKLANKSLMKTGHK